MTLSFAEADYARLKRYGQIVGALALVAGVVGTVLIVDLLRSVEELGSSPPGSIVLTAFVILVWFGLAMFSSLVARDARHATDTHVVLEVGAALAVGFALIAAQALDLVGGAWFITHDTWTVLTFVFAWVVGYALYRGLGNHLRNRFQLVRELSPPPRWLIIVFSITVWIATTALLADAVTAGYSDDWKDGAQRFLVLLPPVPIAIAAYYVAGAKLHHGKPAIDG